jgi:hypothetical protein
MMRKILNSIAIEKFSELSLRSIDSRIPLPHRWHHLLARLALNRNSHRVNPGLYALGNPTVHSPVFVTANYMLSFDALRSALQGFDCYILVLNTHGINVWCAAGKGTFGTEELVKQIEKTSLHQVVNHRKLILPQLGAAGVSAHLVKEQSGFTVEYGPIRAHDLPAYLSSGKVTDEMRQVKFNLKDRLILIPVEVVSILLPLIIAAVLFYVIGGILFSIGVITAILAGVILFPLLLPWLPTPNFSTKGFILGGMLSLPFIIFKLIDFSDVSLWRDAGWALAYLAIFPPVTSFLALNFTGATTFTSRSGVRREIFRYFPVMAWTFGIGLLLSITLTLIRVL